MLKCVIYWIYVALLLTVVHSQNLTTDDPSSPSSSSVTTPSTIPSTASSSESTTVSTASPTTSPASPSESTTVSTASTGSSSQSTTSSSQSTSSPTESTTVSTLKPTTGSSTVGPVTTAAPEPPKPQKGSWNVTSNGTACIRAELAALFIIPLKDNSNRTVSIALSPNASDADSDCFPPEKNDTQILVLTDNTYTFTMEFGRDDKQIFVREMSLSYNIEGIPGSVHTNSSKYFAVKKGNSYLCNSNKNVTIEDVILTVSSLHIQAFGKKENTGFTLAEECDADDDVSQIVPIAVGCALAALVIIVLIAYLVGRRRSRQKGYQSV